jgi:hypothetical protein
MIPLKLAALPIVLIGAGPVLPTQEEQARISEPYSACTKAEAERIDDPQVDIAIVGKAVAAACKQQFNEMLIALGRNLSPEEQEVLQARMSEMQIGFATGAVGTLRFERRARPDRKP